MKKAIPLCIGICSLQFVFTALCCAQSKPIQDKLLPPPPNITIDGDLKDWGDSLRYYNQDKQLNYSLANNQDNLYMAIRMNDRSEQIRILRAGLTLKLSIRGVKRKKALP